MHLLPRICSKTKCHVEGQVVPAPFKDQGQTCTFARVNLRSMRCDLCIGAQIDAHKLGKERERQVIRLKIQLTQEQDLARRKELMNEIAALMPGTLNLGQIAYTNQFVLHTAQNLKRADATFTTEESIDFILHCFVDGHVRGKGQTLTPDQRRDYFQRLDTETFNCIHTGRRLQFFRSFMPDMASPDRLVFVNGNSLDYSHPDQITIRSSWWSNQFFGAQADRDDYLGRLCISYLDATSNLDFGETFAEMDVIIQRFLSTSPLQRNQLNQDVRCLVPVSRVKNIFTHIKNPSRGGKKLPSVNDFINWQEVESVFKAFCSRCVVSGLNGRDFTLSLDRKIDTTGRYNWTDINPMMWSINAAKSCFRFAFETQVNLDLWYAEHYDEYYELVNQTLDTYVMNGYGVNEEDIDRAHNEIAQTWIVVVEMRKYFCDLLRHYHSHGNAQFYHDFIQQ